MRSFIGAIALLFVASHAAYALEDTPQNRSEQASRYIKAVPMKEALQQIMLPALQADPAEAKRMEAMFNYIDYAALDKAVHDTLVKIFTADELAALTDLYLSPAGKSGITKMGLIVAKTMPLILPEYEKAQAAALREIGAQPKQ